MKKVIVAGLLTLFMLAGFAVSAKPRHPNLHAAHELVVRAMERISAAQKANEYDLGGHAAKAKDLLSEAEHELNAAADEANDKK